jgi:hypothetical protein
MTRPIVLSATERRFLRAIARELHRRHATSVPTASEALDVVFKVAHRRRCPRCTSSAAVPIVPRTIRCNRCRHATSLTRGSPWHGSHLDVATRVAAVFHIHVSTESCSAAAFARATGTRYGTALRLLHEARAALDRHAVAHRGSEMQLLGRESASNVAFATVDVDAGRLRIRVHARPSSHGAPRAVDAALWLGRVRAWLGDVFRGVTRRFLSLYLDEVCARYGRVRRARMAASVAVRRAS